MSNLKVRRGSPTKRCHAGTASIGDLKQEIIKVNNRVNQSLFGNGLRWQKVDVIGHKIIILAENMRVKPLAAIDNKDRLATRLADIALLNEYKSRLRQEIQESLGLTVRSILKDYDPEYQLAGTIIVTEERLEDLEIPEQSETRSRGDLVAEPDTRC